MMRMPKKYDNDGSNSADTKRLQNMSTCFKYLLDMNRNFLHSVVKSFKIKVCITYHSNLVHSKIMEGKHFASYF